MASPYADKVLADGAVAYWRLDEASGNALSQVGNFPGTVSGGVTRSQPGALSDGNTAMAFDGVTGKIVTGANVTLPVVATVEAWIKTTDADPQPAISFGALFGVLPTIGTQAGVLWVAYDSANAFSNRSVTDGQWHHVVYVLSSTTCSFYVDGVFDVARAQVRAAATTDIMTIGAGVAPTVPWNGLLDEVAIYNTARTPQQIAAHYALATTSPIPAWHDLRYRYCRFVRAPGWRRSA